MQRLKQCLPEYVPPQVGPGTWMVRCGSRRYIHGAKNGIYIIDLNKTLSQLELAKTFLNDVVLRGEKVLFVGTKKQARDIFLDAFDVTGPNVL